MDNRARDLFIQSSTYGFLGCVCLLFFVAVIFGKEYGRLILFTMVLICSLYCAVMCRYVGAPYEDETKRTSDFGIIGRGTFVGAVKYLSISDVVVLSFLLVSVLFRAS
jgi:hypothetical protein